MKKAFLFSGLLFLLLSACTPYFIVAGFEERTAGHQRIAILPAEMIFTGKWPDELTEEDIRVIQEAESYAFQISFHNELLRSTKSGKKPFRVDIQHYDRTYDLLYEAGFDLKDAWYGKPEVLADVLGVDAVVRIQITKNRIMSDLASFGIELGSEIINILTEGQFWPFIPSGMVVSKEISCSYFLFDGEKGATLWSLNNEQVANWSLSSDAIINDISQTAAKKFPYRL